MINPNRLDLTWVFDKENRNRRSK